MKTQLPSKYPWKSSREPLVGVRKPQVENHCFNTMDITFVTAVHRFHVYLF